MNFNVMGFLIGREMAKKELGDGKDDRANQLGLIGAMTPDPMMGAVYSMMIARNDKAPTEPTVIGGGIVVPPAPVLQPSRLPVDVFIGDALIETTIDFGKAFKDENGGKKI